MTDRRTTLRRVSAAALALVLLGASAGAKEIPPPSSEKVTITFYNYNLASAGIGKEATEQLIKEFMEKNPSITVEAVGVSSNDMTARMQADIVAGRSPDLAQLIFNDLDYMVTNFGIQPLQDIIPAGEWREHTQRMVPAGLQLAAIHGKMYGLAYTFSTPVLFYNADLFRAAGLNPDSPPKTWADIKAASLQIKSKTSKEGFYPGVYGQFDWLMQGVILSNGGRVLSEDRKTLTFGEKPAVEAIQMLRDLRESGAHANISANDAADAMRSGNLGMFLNTSAYQRLLMDSANGKYELRAAKMPAFGDKPTGPTNSGSGLFVLAKDPKKQRAAWELMKYLTSERGYTIITSKIGYLPLRLDIVDDPNYLGEWTKENPLVRPNLEQLTYLKPWESIPGPNYKQIQRIETQAFEQAVFGNGDVQQIMSDAQKRAQALMPR
jgi:multiple sugar transport system substrate-binding protein